MIPFGLVYLFGAGFTFWLVRLNMAGSPREHDDSVKFATALAATAWPVFLIWLLLPRDKK